MQCPNCNHEMWEHVYKDKGVHSYNGPSEWWCVCGLRIGYFCNQPLGVDEIEQIECPGKKIHTKYVEL